MAGLCLSWRMVRWILVLPMVAMLAGCAAPTERAPDAAVAAKRTDAQTRPQSRPAGVVPTSSARTETEFDTATPQEQSEAQVVPAAGSERALGTTVASLGAPSEPGFWLKTPLVTQEASGRVVHPTTGKSVQVTLIPIDGPATAGSRMSLSALRLLEAPLTGLTEVQVFVRG